MKIHNVNKMSIAIAIIMMLSVTAVFTSIPSANAATQMIDTYSYIAVAPNPIGIGQNLLVTFRLDKVSPTAAAYNQGTMFTGFSVTITKPDGTIETKSGLTADPTSNGWFNYVPTTAGTYKLQTHFPGQRINGTMMSFFGPPTVIDNTYKPSDSPVITVTVQEQPILPSANNPLPTGYWTRPVYGENKGWNVISGNWLMQGYDALSRSFGSGNAAFNPYTTAPNTAHILWTRPIMLGGVVGGPFGDKTYYQGLSYEEHYNPIILNGRIIFQEHYLDQSTTYDTRCVDLYTGKDIWVLNNTNINFAQVVEIDNPNEHGALAYLWDTGPGGLFAMASNTWKMYDAWTGNYMLTMANVTWGGAGGFGVNTVIFGQNGEILCYSLNSATNKLTLWNSTKVLYTAGFIDTWGPTIGAVYNGNTGIEWSVTIPQVPPGTALEIVKNGYALAQYTDSSTVPSTYVQMVYDVSSMKKSGGSYPTTLNPLWVANRTGILETFFIQGPMDSGIYTLYDESKLLFHAYSITTGAELWVTEPYTSGWASFNWQWYIAYGMLYEAGYDGHVRAYDTTNGHLVWDTYFGSTGFETPYGEYPVYNGFNIADGKIYITNDEHSPDAVPWRGGKLWCFDAYNGTLLWTISGKLRMGAIADGIYTSLNSLDGQIYTFGKGPTTTTVAAPQVAVPKGTGVMITGTVTDQSPGAKDTPAISDAYMTPWMEYMYEQKPFPSSATGVPVTLTAIDPNGNSQTIGTATSDISGSYGLMWIPPVEGTYQITATFAGSNSYGGSYDMTYMGVGPAAATPAPVATPTPTPVSTPTSTPVATASPSPAPQPEAGPSTDMYVIAAAAVVIIVVVAVAALVLRKRK